MRRLVGVLLLALTGLATAGWAATPTPQATAELAHLLQRLESSGCEFQRNGAWHAAPDARKHLEKKYRYLVDKGLVATAEDFIDRGATESSVSGQPYQVRCGGAAPVASERWLREELQRFRAQQNPRPRTVQAE